VRSPSQTLKVPPDLRDDRTGMDALLIGPILALTFAAIMVAGKLLLRAVIGTMQWSANSAK
jgi:hypothetical protein